MFTDAVRHNVWTMIRQHGLRAFADKLPEEVFAQAADRAGVRLGSSALSLVQLVWLGVTAAVETSRNFASVLSITLKLLEDASDWQSSALAAARDDAQRRASSGQGRRKKHDPRGHDPTQVTEEAFAQARARMPLAFWTALLVLLGERFEQEQAAWARWKGFRLLALDGTCVDLPAWRGLREHFGTAKNGKSQGKTQARMVMLQLPLVRLPWRYEVCPLATGERTVAERLLTHLRPNDLVLIDQGFWSYGLFHQVHAAGAYFAIRLYPQVSVRTLRRLGPKDRLVRWTKPGGPRWRKADLPESIDLRIVDYQMPGFRPSAVVTNVLDSRQISRDDWIRMATQTEPGQRRLMVGLYHRRWEIETTYRELKVTQGMEGGLRGRTPQCIQYEIAGHVLLYLLVRWLMVEAAQTHQRDPLELSFRGALQELADMRPILTLTTPERIAQVLWPRLLERVASHRVPFRPGRHFPRPHDTQVRNLGNGKKKLPHKLKQAA